MSLEQLKIDLKDNIKSLNQLGALTTAPELVAHLQNTLWPTLESIVEEMEEQDGCIEDLMNGSEDILQPDTGNRIMVTLVAAVTLVNELRARLQPHETAQMKAVAEFDRLANDCIATVQEITIPEDDQDPAELEDAEDEDDDDEDDDEEGDE